MRMFSVVMLAALSFGADLTPQTQRAFDRYIQLTEAKLDRNLNRDFLYSDPNPEERTKLRSGDVLIRSMQTRDNARDIDVPGGLIQDWLGILFIRGATIAQVRAVMQDYPAYKSFYKPDVIESKLRRQNGNEYDIFLRLFKKQFLTVV